MKQLIVNADDFGLTPGVNRAIIELATAGCLTSATLMAAAPATDEAIQLARQTPALSVGCHVVLVDGVSCLDRATQQLFPWIHSETEAGQLPATPGQLLRALFSHGVRQSKRENFLEAEAFAQITRLQQAGLTLTHIDTHKHLHQFPAILRPVLRAARRAGIHRIRNPFEPHWSQRATQHVPLARLAQFRALQLFRGRFHRIVAQEGFTTSDGAVGVLTTGSLDRASLEDLLAAMPDGRWELVTHPGYQDATLAQIRTRLRASREREIDALHLIGEAHGIERISFGSPAFTP